MPNGEILSREDRIKEAEETLRNLGAGRGDSFDIGEFGEEEKNPDLITSLITNPERLMSSFNLSRAQANNIRSLLVGGGTGAVYRYLSQHLGGEVAGIIGGFLSAWVARRIVK